MFNVITSRFVTVSAYAISGVTAAGMAVALATLLSANPKGPDAHGQAVALVACAGLAGTCLTLAAGASVDD
tara:strand:- start:1665 stop:1877 length:213 start_codon:yes stop_codon:yes gene_type:complete